MKRSLAILLLGICVSGTTPRVHAQAPPRTAPTDSLVSGEAAPLSAADAKARMRKLWEDHLYFMNQYVATALDDRPTAKTFANQLIRNEEAITEFFRIYYGDASAGKLDVLLRNHIMIAADVVKAHKMVEKDALPNIYEKWDANAKNLAAFLCSTNPAWNQKDLEILIRAQLDLFSDHVVARMDNNTDGDARAYRDAHNNILRWADVLSAGIANQFPDRFTQARN